MGRMSCRIVVNACYALAGNCRHVTVVDGAIATKCAPEGDTGVGSVGKKLASQGELDTSIT